MDNAEGEKKIEKTGERKQTKVGFARLIHAV